MAPKGLGISEHRGSIKTTRQNKQTKPAMVTMHVIPRSGGWGWGQQSKVTLSLRPACWDSGDFKRKEEGVRRKKEVEAQRCPSLQKDRSTTNHASI